MRSILYSAPFSRNILYHYPFSTGNHFKFNLGQEKCSLFLFPLLLFIRLTLTVQCPICLTRRFISHFMSRSENFLLEIFQGCCLLFNYQGSVLFRCIFATALIDYHIFRRLSTTFLNYFLLSFFKKFCHPTAHLDYHICHFLSTHFFYFFQIILISNSEHIYSLLYSVFPAKTCKWNLSHKNCLNMLQTALRLTEKEGFEPSRRY